MRYWNTLSTKIRCILVRANRCVLNFSSYFSKDRVRTLGLLLGLLSLDSSSSSSSSKGKSFSFSNETYSFSNGSSSSSGFFRNEGEDPKVIAEEIDQVLEDLKDRNAAKKLQSIANFLFL
jgi:hypothetical protein